MSALTDLPTKPTTLPRPDDALVSVRPWGDFEQFTLNEPTTVKIITVTPGHRLSLQKHQHRGELWKVLEGPMDIEVDGRSWTASTGDTIWVPQGGTHRMSNSGTAPARILEIAYGHFDEDDIERLHDDYTR
jgi:mannose-6-phosphate isomerase